MRNIVSLIIVTLFSSASPVLANTEKPNVVLMVVDNLGWGEIGAYGGGILRGAETPRLDQLANEGVKLLNFNVEPQCTPSRSALMSGRHPIRSGTTSVVWGMPFGLVGWEKTIAELMSEQGYSTGMFGKWHLGEIKGRYPTDQGFDEWYGILNTTDEAMYTSQNGYDPSLLPAPQIMKSLRGKTPTPIKEYNLTTRKTIDSELAAHAIDFMSRSVKAKKPFFAYVPFTQPHLPPTSHPDFEGKTGNGQWADMLSELDYRAGQVLDAIDNLEIRDNTIVVWMSENGPEEAPSYYGTAGYWRGNYFTTLEGSLRAPFMIRWPSKIPKGFVSNEIVHITDILPTLSSAAGYEVPNDREIDGVDQMDFLKGKSKESLREGFPAYNGDRLQAYKFRDYKVEFYKQDSMFDPAVKWNFPRVYDLRRDPKELNGLYGSQDSGTESLTWLLPVVTKEIIKFKKTLVTEPPIKLGTLEPYKPKKQ